MTTLIQEWKDRATDSKRRLSEEMHYWKQAKISDLDQKAISSHEDVSAKIDCLQCANCCKTTVTTFDNEDIGRAAKTLGISKKAFIKKFLIHDGAEYVNITTPCPMLNSDNTCKIYEARPKACGSFPHTSRAQFVNRINAHTANIDVCPITYHTIRRMEAMINS